MSPTGELTTESIGFRKLMSATDLAHDDDDDDKRVGCPFLSFFHNGGKFTR